MLKQNYSKLTLIRSILAFLSLLLLLWAEYILFFFGFNFFPRRMHSIFPYAALYNIWRRHGKWRDNYLATISRWHYRANQMVFCCSFHFLVVSGKKIYQLPSFAAHADTEWFSFRIWNEKKKSRKYNIFIYFFVLKSSCAANWKHVFALLFSLQFYAFLNSWINSWTLHEPIAFDALVLYSWSDAALPHVIIILRFSFVHCIGYNVFLQLFHSNTQTSHTIMNRALESVQTTKFVCFHL